ncbi:hypothetical protein B0H14DRAFT_2797890 [Mycena olivaceomarginata]|nr:hypothetical protein B0H14DRAFT_2797890 [Mycena olivaceomarginata]
MSKLPPISTVELNHEGNNMWPLILRAEEAALAEATKLGHPEPGLQKYTDNLIGARVVGFLLQDLWKHQSHSFGLIPYKYLVREISLCFSVAGVGVGTEAEAQAQYTAIYKLVRSDGGPVPTASHHPSRPSMEQVRERIIKEMQTPTTEPDARRHQANSAQDGDKAEYAASAMVILKMFGLTDKAESLVGGNKVIGEPNTYDVCAAKPSFFTRTVGPPDRRDIQGRPGRRGACRANKKPVPALPSPTLLAIRAACSRVAHMSGAAEQLIKFRDLEDTHIMAEDGSTSPRSVRITA